MTTRYTFYLIVIGGYIITGCRPEIQNNVIIGKSHLTVMSEPMPKGICRFWIGKEYHQFDDSCHFYHILDTIK